MAMYGYVCMPCNKFMSILINDYSPTVRHKRNSSNNDKISSEGKNENFPLLCRYIFAFLANTIEIISKDNNSFVIKCFESKHQ